MVEVRLGSGTLALLVDVPFSREAGRVQHLLHGI
jgi:hypothetical protein